MLRNIFNFLVFALLTCDPTRGDYFEECRNVDLTFIEVETNCSLYIFCHGDDSYKDACPEESPYFSAIDQTCDINSAVCQNRAYANMETTSIPLTSVETSSTTSTSALTSPATPFSIPTAPSTNPTQSTSTVTSTASIAITSPNPTMAVIAIACPAIDDPSKAIFLPNSKSCSDYFLCYHGEPLAMHCSNMLHFDNKLQKCDYPEKVSCQLESVTPREQCLPHIFDVFPHPNNCNYYYLCSYGYLMVMQCPLRMGWDYEKRACSVLTQAKCFNTLQRFKI